MDIHKKFSVIETLIFDVDGVWTNGDVMVPTEGELIRTMNTKDGYAGRRAVLAGYNMVIITGGYSEGVKTRFEKLGMAEVHIGVRNKIDLFDKLVKENKINPHTSLYVGDDLPDCKVLKAVHLPCCPKDAAPEILETCEYISPYPGGKGCVRDIIEKVMRIQNKW